MKKFTAILAVTGISSLAAAGTILALGSAFTIGMYVAFNVMEDTPQPGAGKKLVENTWDRFEKKQPTTDNTETDNE